MQQNPNLPNGEINPNYHPAIVERLKEVQKIKSKRADLFCPNHPEEPGETTCAVCDHLFCHTCIKSFKTFHLCPEHLPLLMNNEWSEIVTVKTSTVDPEKGVRLFDFKKELFQNQDIPTYIETHYKINVDQDNIETYVVLHAIKSQQEEVKQKLAEADI